MFNLFELTETNCTFEESFQKAIRQVDPRLVGFQGDPSMILKLDYESRPTDDI
jgi:carbamoylphosphate synthase large subunit